MISEKTLLEEFGIDVRFIKGIGLYSIVDGSSPKQSIKLYIPKHDIELYQVMAIFLKLNGHSISNWLREKLKEFAKDLKDQKHPMFEEAKRLHREIKELQYLRMIENSQKE